MADDGVGMGFSFNFDTTDGAKERPKDAPKAGEAKLDSPAAGKVGYEAPPLRVVALANFCGAPASRSPQRIVVRAVQDLDDLPGRLGASLFFTVEDQLRGDPKGIEVRLEPKTLADLSPEGVAAAIPGLELPRKLVREIAAVEAGERRAADFRAGLDVYAEVKPLAEAVRLAVQDLGAAPAAPAGGGGAPATAEPAKPAASSDDPLDNIFSMVDAPTGGDADAPPPPPPPETPPKAGSSGIGSAISAIGGGAGARQTDLSAARMAAQGVVDRQLDAVLHHPQFREVEAAWRGLQLLAAKGDMRAPFRIEVLDAARDALTDVFHEHVYEVEYAGRGESPLSLAVVDYRFSRKSADLAVLEQLAAEAEAIQAPVVASLETDFFGVEAKKLAGMTNPRSLFDEGFAEWNGKRKADATRWLVCGYNRLLLRAPHRPSRKRGPYTEGVAGPEDLLWGNAGWAIALAAAGSTSRTGWPTQLAGYQDGELADMVVWHEEGRDPAGPTEVALSEDCVEDLAAQGITGITAVKRRDSALVLRAPVVHRITGGEPKIRGTLAYQLLAARLGETLLAYKDRLAGDRSPEGIRQRFEAFLGAVLGDTGPGAGAQVQVQPQGDRLIVHAALRTGRAVMGGVELELGVPV